MAAAAAALAVSALGASVYQGEVGRKQQKKALGAQRQAQEQAMSSAAAEQRRAEEEYRRANRRQPNVGTLLAGEQQSMLTGPASTLLTGPGGINPQRLGLGRTSLLGG